MTGTLLTFPFRRELKDEVSRMDLWTSVYRFIVVLVDRNTVDIYFS